jgi:hypothetical protein
MLSRKCVHLFVLLSSHKPCRGQCFLKFFCKCTYYMLPHKVRVRITLRLAVYHQSVHLGADLLETQGQNFFSQLNTCCHSPYITSCLMRGWVCHLQLLLAPASAFILGSMPRNHVYLSILLSPHELYRGHRFLQFFYCNVHIRCCGKSESELLYDWRFSVNQFVLAPSPLRLTARIFFLN